MAGANQDFRSSPKSSRKKDFRSSQAKPGRALLLILTLTVALTGGMLLSGENTPRLGIDLAGGTSITLTATDDARNDGAVTQGNLNTAVDIIESRVNGLGVSEAEVQTQGDRNIVVNVPQGTDEDQAREQVGTTAQLGFRPVWSADMVTAPGEEGELPEGLPEGLDPEDLEGLEDLEDLEDLDLGDLDPESLPDDPEAGDAEDGTEDLGMPRPQTAPQGNTPVGAVDARPAAFPAQDGEEDPDSAEEAEEPEDAEEGEESPAPEEDAEEPVEPPAEDGMPPAVGEEQSAGGGPGDLSEELAQLDCSTADARHAASDDLIDAQDDQPIVACDEEGTFKYEMGPVMVPGTDVDSADNTYDMETGDGWIVNMTFTSEGATKFADITSQLQQHGQPRNQFAIVLDGQVISAPTVNERIGGGAARITGNFDSESSAELANILQFGALPITFEEGNVTTISPTLGDEQLKAGLIAGGIGLLLVFGYLFFYYRALSLVAIGSLVVMGLLTYLIMTLLGPAVGFALSLPAICGAIVAVGITADSFIVYFERIRDEVREGRPIRAAIERGWPRARRTIIVSDVVSFLAAVVLFLVSVGTVQGFAFVLGLTTLLDLVIVFLMTKPLVTLAARRKFFARGHKWSGLDPQRLGARPPIRRSTRRPAPVTAAPKEV